MPNLQGASPVGRDEGGRSSVTQTGGKVGCWWCRRRRAADSTKGRAPWLYAPGNSAGLVRRIDGRAHSSGNWQYRAGGCQFKYGLTNRKSRLHMLGEGETHCRESLEIARMLREGCTSPKQSGSQDSLTRRGDLGVVEDSMRYGRIEIVTGIGAVRQLRCAVNPNHREEGEVEQGVDSVWSTRGSLDSENDVYKREGW